jgi:hypothetical protein
MATTASRGPGTLTFHTEQQDWAKPSNFTRNCFSFRLCARRKPLWGTETFGGHQSYGVSSRHPSLGCPALASVASSCLRHVVRYSHGMDVHSLYARNSKEVCTNAI